jgi:hypothetical protein
VPTNRRKIPPRRINVAVPQWARRLLETGEKPEEGTPDHVAYFGWFIGDEVPGLPPSDSPEGHRLFMGRKRKRNRVDGAWTEGAS